MYCCTLRHINSIRFLEERLFDFIVFLISQSLCAAIKQLIPIFQGKFLGANCYNRHEPIVTGRIDIFLPFCRDKAVARVYKQRKFVHKFYASLRILPKIQAPIFTAMWFGLQNCITQSMEAKDLLKPYFTTQQNCNGGIDYFVHSQECVWSSQILGIVKTFIVC